MELKDLFLTPFYLGLFYALAFAVRPRVTNIYTRQYFIPALSLKFAGAIALGLIYQFYYGGGDTFNYFHHTSIIQEAFGESFSTGLKLLTATDKFDPEIIRYSGRMFWFGDNTEFFVVRIGAIIGLLCFNTYSVVALFFALISFTGMWVMYMTFARIYPAAYKQLAIAVFFLPSVFFWGSGFLKDSLCIGALGWVFYGFYNALIEKRNILFSAIMGLLGAYLLVEVKVYILMSFLAPAIFWVFNENNRRIKNATVRMLAKPFFIVLGALIGLLGATQLTEGDERFDVDQIGERTRITQQALYSRTKDEGSGYNIGNIDGSLSSIVSVAPQAVFVSIFRPFLWEVRNPVMLLSALEAFWFTVFTLRIFFRTGFLRTIGLIASRPIISFCFIFTIILAIGVGTNSGNFGTLVRYKIPLMPFYLAALYILQAEAARQAKPARRITAAA
ncbi:hypothetical protein [Hymenobacter psychrotolerans]|uniref:Dolichyl-phosphate-mannose-protein mannosyltransferase n=1 Tax=Hymenobacter psychrotolerans DSM 18569 TaxID=1121959 RepID=A0A1M7BHE6_9BACT|nr:hypothetical protein [Hymenobacter psychrotolerans]SHL54458.1 hypothetical protein SAMN02746009_02919 [Hymenobacter psychrotolerans DSM 18569]